MRTLPAKRNYLLLVPTLIFVLGFALIVAGVVVEFVGKPESGGQSYRLYLFMMKGGVIVWFLGMCALLAQGYFRNDDPPASEHAHPRKAMLLLLIGTLLIFVGVAMELTSRPHLGGQRSLLYDASMGIGGCCELVGAWLSWRWFRIQKSRARTVTLS